MLWRLSAALALPNAPPACVRIDALLIIRGADAREDLGLCKSRVASHSPLSTLLCAESGAVSAESRRDVRRPVSGQGAKLVADVEADVVALLEHDEIGRARGRARQAARLRLPESSCRRPRR